MSKTQLYKFDNQLDTKLSKLHILKTPTRTEGDGMENTGTTLKSTNGTKVTENGAISSIDKNSSIIRGGKIVHIIPRDPTNSKSSLLVHVSKEPKYVPYEPYKAAVKPNMPSLKAKKTVKSNIKKKPDIPVVEVHEKQLPSPVVKPNVEKLITNVQEIITDPVQEEMKNMSLVDSPEIENEIKRLKLENIELENQVKYQAQVNGELKKLLLAAVGEDIETKVNHLTEDKLHLAQALLNSAQKLNTHQDQMEYLAGQCEVWRSKFLASSLMVEELAKWKAALTQKVCDYQDITKKLLSEHQHTHSAISKTYLNLVVLGINFDLAVMTNAENMIKPKSSNTVDLSQDCESLSSSLKEQLLGSSPFEINTNVPDLSQGDSLTPGEKQAYQCANESLTLAFGKTDVACSAVMGAAGAVSGLTNSLSLYHPPCCTHCKDRNIQTI